MSEPKLALLFERCRRWENACLLKDEEIAHLSLIAGELAEALERIDAVAVAKRAGSAVEMQRIARAALAKYREVKS